MLDEFEVKNWIDGEDSGTPITASDMNRIENGIASVTSSTKTLYETSYYMVTDKCYAIAIGKICIVNVSYVCAPKVASYSVLGYLPDTMTPNTDLFPSTYGNQFIAPLCYRGMTSNNDSGFITIKGDGEVQIWTSTINPYYSGMIVFPIK